MSKRILVVDDSLLMYQKLVEELKDTEFEVTAYAKDGETAVEMYDEYKPDIVTMDIIMPGIDGIEAAERILEKDKNANIVMVSSLGDDDIIEQANEKGIKQFICKPFERSQILKELRKIK